MILRGALAWLLALALLVSATEVALGQAGIYETESVKPPATPDGLSAFAASGQHLLLADMGPGIGKVYAYDVGPPITPLGSFTGNDTTFADSFGISMAIDGDDLVVGAPFHGQKGAAYVFHWNGSAWAQVAKLLASDPAVDSGFGVCVDIEGDRIVVGADGAVINGLSSAGAVYVFERTSGTWNQTHKVTAPDPSSGGLFGRRIALDGNRMAVNADATSAVESVRVLRLTQTGWVQEGKIVIPFLSLDLDGDRLAIGGATPLGLGVEIYGWTGSAWTSEATLNHVYGKAGDRLGASVLLAGDRLLAGAPFHAHWEWHTGMAVLFERVQGTWVESLRLQPSTSLPEDQTGRALGLDGQHAFVMGLQRAHRFDLPTLVGQPICSGNGSANPCPCGNQCPAELKHGCRNSLGFGACLTGTGSASVAADDLRLSAEYLTNHSTSIAIVGRELLLGGGGAPFSNGLLCIGAPILRLTSQVTNPLGGGLALFGPGVASMSQCVPGETCYFQVWYRDSVGPCGGVHNLTNALQVVFEP